MPGIAMDEVLSRVRQSELEKFDKKMTEQEQAKAEQLISEGLKNMNMLLEDAKTQTNMDYLNHGRGRDTEPEPIVVTEDKDQPSNEVFAKFLEQLK